MGPSPLSAATAGPAPRITEHSRSTFADLNTYLDSVRTPDRFPEQELFAWFHRLQEHGLHPHPAYWLCLARLAEAALLTAGFHADRADFRTAGDLLVNPRRIHVQELGSPRMVRKQRHTPLSDQFAASDRSPRETLKDLSRTAMIYIAEDAILPTLSRRLEESGRLDPSYIQSLASRMERIGQVLNFLACDGISTPRDWQHKLASLTPGNRAWYRSNLCNFDTSLYWQVGLAVRLSLQETGMQLPFPVHPQPQEAVVSS